MTSALGENGRAELESRIAVSRQPSILIRALFSLIGPALVAGALAACSGSSQQTCEDYVPPLASCPMGTQFVCETTADGCRICSCESTGPPVDIGPPEPGDR